MACESANATATPLIIVSDWSMQLRTNQYAFVSSCPISQCHANFTSPSSSRQAHKQAQESRSRHCRRVYKGRAWASQLLHVVVQVWTTAVLGEQWSLVGPITATAAARWKELHGERSWEGLLRPLDLELRRKVIWYGEMAQATYDAFNHERHSPHAGLSRFGRKRFFERVMLPGHAAAYRVTRFLYATSSAHAAKAVAFVKGGHPRSRCRESNWIGYVAVATDAGKSVLGRRDVVVAWRGTIQALEWTNNLEFAMVHPSGILGDATGADAMVHRGWLSIYTSTDPASTHNKDSARSQVLAEVRKLVDTYKDEEVSITVTGHSLGAALATLSAFDIAENGYNCTASATFPVTAFAFASPRVGGASFKKRLDTAAAAGLRVLRVRNARDIVPGYPALPYHDVGAELVIDTSASPYLKAPGDENLWHNLECYLHGVAGAPTASGQGFEHVVERDVALVNKSYDALKEEHGVPAAWWVPWNRGMVKGGDGRWRLVDCEDEDDREDAAVPPVNK
ncbi:phospholipase A1-II 6-like [Triticum urartu]|nr:phospholipase A1-II 6-like [Triticum urartu]XP_048552862.1 phospholipase A1-II 6-like [Triticum urartu]